MRFAGQRELGFQSARRFLPYATTAALTALTALSIAPSASAAGLYFSDRGVRPLGRGGAFVAGADDLGAMWYNPAGLADAGDSFLIDAAWMNFSSKFTRKAQVVDAGGTVRIYDYPTVEGTTSFLPIPTLGASRRLDAAGNWTFGGGINVPYGVIASYPRTQNGKPAASRYSLISLDGSALVVLTGNFAYKFSNSFRVGFGLQSLVGKFATATTFNANPADRFIGAPEDPSYDTFAQLDVAPIITLPSVNLGATWVPSENFRFAVSGFTPYYVSSPATTQVQLPNAAVFDRARQEGSKANVSFWLPPVARVGAEFRTQWSKASELRVEVAYVREFWSVHKDITITPKDINLVGIIGFPSPFPVAPITLKRNFQDSNSIRLGAELTIPCFLDNSMLTLRAGASYEDSAVPTDYVSPITVDTNKIAVTGGLGLHVGKHWRFDAMFAQLFADKAVVNPATAALPPVNPVKGFDASSVAINGGTYEPRATVIGIGLNYRFDVIPEPRDLRMERDKARADGIVSTTPTVAPTGAKPGEWSPDKPADPPVVAKPPETAADKPPAPAPTKLTTQPTTKPRR